MDRSVTDFNVRLRTIRIRDLIIGMILCSIIAAILMFVFPIIYESDDIFFVVFLGIGILLFALALTGTKGLGKNFKNLFEDNHEKEILYVFILNIIFAMLFMYLISGLDMIMGFSDPTWISIWDIDTVDVDSATVLLDSITAILFAPILEELIFRGVLFNRFKIRIGIVPAMLLSSFIFAIGHDFGGITSAFLFGICMCILYLKTDNILIPMSVHFINNVFATVLEMSGIDVITAQFPWIIPSIIITLIGTVYLIRYIILENKKLKERYSGFKFAFKT